MNTIFHYCSTNTFHSIISNKAIWLSSLKLSNDSLEGRIITNELEMLIENDRISQGHKHILRFLIQELDSQFHCGGFCLSRKGDLLSQWRGYADDGNGFSIGFSRHLLSHLGKLHSEFLRSFKLCDVIYNSTEYSQLLSTAYHCLREAVITTGKYEDLDAARTFTKTIFHDPEQNDVNIHRFFEYISSSLDLYRFKHHAFSEEKEVRLLCDFLFSLNQLNFRPSKNKLIPYTVLDISKFKRPCDVIQEVIVGPKNNTPLEYVGAFLKNNGFANVKVKKSIASYQ